jgi:hypothetical protein
VEAHDELHVLAHRVAGVAADRLDEIAPEQAERPRR